MGTLYPGQDPPAPGPYVMSCDTLAGDPVANSAGEELGHVAHVMIDVPSGRIAYAVVASGGVFGIGEKLFAVPWGALTLDAGRHCFLMEVARARFDAAPGFDKDHWPSMADEDWARRVHDYYGVRRYGKDRERLQ